MLVTFSLPQRSLRTLPVFVLSRSRKSAPILKNQYGVQRAAWVNLRAEDDLLAGSSLMSFITISLDILRSPVTMDDPSAEPLLGLINDPDR